jgi:hypothetical protein
MNEFVYTKSFGMIVGMMTIIAAIGYGILAFIGSSLSQALHSANPEPFSQVTFIVLALLTALGLITAIGALGLNSRTWKTLYTAFCILMGFGFVILYFISFGSLGTKIETFILCMGLVYLLLSYLVIRRK